MSSAVLHAATGAPASRPRGAFGASRGPRVARRGCVAARATSAGPSDWDLDGAPDGVVLRLAKRLERAWRALPDVADAPCAPDLKSVDAIAEDGDPTTAVRIENLVFTNAAFRKMHLEVAWGLGGLEVSLLGMPDHLDLAAVVPPGVDLMALPAMDVLLPWILRKILGPMFVYPSRMIIPIMDNSGLEPPATGTTCTSGEKTARPPGWCCPGVS